MSDLLRIGLPAAIAAAATVLVALLGYRQWKRQQEVSLFGQFHSEKQTVYKTIWEALARVHPRHPEAALTKEELLKHRQELMAFVLTNRIHIHDQDEGLIANYLKAVEQVQTYESERKSTRFRPRAYHARDIRDRYREWRQVDEAHQAIVRRWRKVLGGRSN